MPLLSDMVGLLRGDKTMMYERKNYRHCQLTVYMGIVLKLRRFFGMSAADFISIY